MGRFSRWPIACLVFYPVLPLPGAAKKQWRDLAPVNQDKVPYGGILGVAYDSRNRQVLVLKSDHGSRRG